MAFVRLNRARMSTATTGTGTITLGSAIADAAKGYFRSFSSAGIADGDSVHYLILEGSTWELGHGVYTASGTTLSRTLIASSTNSLISLTGAADVSVVPIGADWTMVSGKGSDVASAATLTLGDNSYYHVTGTTTITDIDFSKAYDGRIVTLIFDGALTLTHNATTLKLPGGASITTAAGDRGIFVQDNGDNITCIAYIRAGGLAVDTSSTATLTNKRITPRAFSETTNATPTPAADSYDQHNITAQAGAAAFAAPTGTPTDSQKLIIRIKDNGTARALSWNAIYRAVGAALPTTTVISKTLYIGLIYNTADSKWDCVVVAQET